MKTALIYTRVSSSKQVDNTSPRTQLQECETWCRRNQARVVARFYDAAETAKTAQRPQFLAAIDWARKHKPDIFLVWKFERFARNADDHTACRVRLASVGTRLISVTEPTPDTTQGLMLQSLHSWMAQLDNEGRAARTKVSMADVVRRGGWVWQAPYGFRLVRRSDGLPVLEPHADQAAHVRQLFEAIAGSRLSHADALREGARMTGMGAQAVHALLRKSVYAGIIRSRLLPGQEVRASFGGLIDQATWERAQLVIDGRMKTAAPRARRVETYPLRGLIRCGSCSTRLTAAASRGRGGRYEYYFCRHGHERIRASTLHDQFEAFLNAQAAALRPDLETIARGFRSGVVEDHREAVALRSEAASIVRAIEARRDRLTEAYMAGAIPLAEFEQRRGKLDVELAERRQESTAAAADQEELEAAVLECLALLQDPAKLWRQYGLDLRQMLVQTLFGSTLRLNAGEISRTAASDGVAGTLCALGATCDALAPQGMHRVELAALLQYADRIATLMRAA